MNKKFDESLFSALSAIDFGNLPHDMWKSLIFGWVDFLNENINACIDHEQFMDAYSDWLALNESATKTEPTINDDNRFIIWQAELLDRIANIRFEIKNQLAIEQSSGELALCGVEHQLQEVLRILDFIQHGQPEK